MRSDYKKETVTKIKVYYDHEDIEEILAHHAAQQKGMNPEDVQAVNLEGGDALCKAAVVLEKVEVDEYD